MNAASFSDFRKFVKNNEKEIKRFYKLKKTESFLNKSNEFYSKSMIYFYEESNQVFEICGVKRCLDVIDRSSALVLKKIKEFKIDEEKIVVIYKDLTKKEYKLINIEDFVKKNLDYDESKFGYFLLFSYFLNPKNYTKLQLFSAYRTEKKETKASHK